jgi:hypothetical protein
MKTKHIILLSLFVTFSFVAIVTLTQKNDTEIQVDNQIDYFNDLEDVNFYINGDYFNDYFRKIYNGSLFDFDGNLITDGVVNIYIINLEETNISSSDYTKLNDILLSSKDVIIYFLGGVNYDFLDVYLALSIDREGNKNFINQEAYIIRIDNLDNEVKMSQVSSEDSKDMLFSDLTYLQYRVYHKIQRDLVNYYKKQ